VHAVFRRLPHLPVAGAGQDIHGGHHIEGKPPPSPVAGGGAGGAGFGVKESGGSDAAAVAAAAEVGPGAADLADSAAAEGAAAGAGASAAGAAGEGGAEGAAAPAAGDTSGGGGSGGASKPVGAPFGLACVLEIFRFSVSFISLEDGSDENAESMCAFGLQLVLGSLESAGRTWQILPATSSTRF